MDFVSRAEQSFSPHPSILSALPSHSHARPITPFFLSVISSSLIMNPTGVLFIRQAGGERPASHADPATPSSLGIWHRNFNRRATQAGGSVRETHCACQSELTNRREHSKCAALLAWQCVTSVVEGKEDREGIKVKKEKKWWGDQEGQRWGIEQLFSRGEWRRREGQSDKGLAAQRDNASHTNKAGRAPANCLLFMLNAFYERNMWQCNMLWNQLITFWNPNPKPVWVYLHKRCELAVGFYSHFARLGNKPFTFFLHA